MLGQFAASGTMDAKVIRMKKAPLSWKLRNNLTWSFIWGWIVNNLAHLFSKITGVPTITAELSIRAFLSGEWVDYGVVSRRVVTDAGVTYMRDDFNNASGGADISIFNFHGAGTGTGVEAASDTALGTESTTALNPDSTRATGSRSVPASNQFRSVGTLTYDADTAVTEHGLFTTSGTGTGTLWDRSKFAAINVVGANGDSIQFTYTLTLTSGG